MTAGWVAGGVRAQAMARRRLGTAACRALAASSAPDAVEALARSPYGQRVRAGDRLADAVRGVAETLLWNLRVLAGWLPAEGAEMLRVLAGWFEIANVDEHLRTLTGQPADAPFRLGTLATVWPQLARTGSRDELRAALTASPWRNPGGTTPRDIQLAMRVAWADRVVARVDPARAWAYGAVALLVARERFAADRSLPGPALATAGHLLGAGVLAAASLGELTTALPARARWALDGVTDRTDLWVAEARWWRRVRTDGATLLAGSGFGPGRVIGATGLLAADAWLVRAALEAAAREGNALEVFDAVA
jgi:hypothetical protein